MVKVKPNIDYMNKDDLDEIWKKARKCVDDKDFLKKLMKFDVRSI
jgi:hypothetical protein